MNYALLAAGLSAVLLISAASGGAPPPGRELLPAYAVPTAYRIEITPDVATLSFGGREHIELDVTEATDRLVLNSRDITIDRAVFSAVDGDARIEYDEKTERVTLLFGIRAAPGHYALDIAYRGKIYETSYGLFVSPYSDKGAAKTMLATQFEPGGARRLAPMWDEPTLKAEWQLSLAVAAEDMAVSNMPAGKTVLMEDGRKMVTFAPTPKMSSYLLFLASGDFDRITAKQGETEIGVVTRKGESARARFALDLTGPVLAYYNDYFGTAYPLPKLDHIGAPGGGGFGAMENWGAIFYFESALLVDPALTTETDRQRIYGTIAHEMAHQWFGDLVTMAWWDDLWLNEGFASWMQKKAADHFHPEWNIWLQAIKTQQTAMKADARASTHPVVQPVMNAAEAETAFDEITYDKGQAVIRMIEAYLGEEAFRDGLRSYMQKHHHANAVTEDLWTELEAASHTPVSEIAREFTTQPGIPMIVVDSISCKDGKSIVALHQDRFGVDEASKTALRWHVPVVAASLGGEPVRALVDGKAELTMAGCGTVKLNAGNSGYFRTLYPADAFAALKADFARLPAADQLGLLYDTWALGSTGYQPVGDYLALSGALDVGADPMVWLQAVNTYSELVDLYRGQKGADEFAAYARGRLKPLLARIGWEGPADEAPNVGILRDALIEVLAKLQDPEVIAEAQKRFAAFEADPRSLPGGIRRAVTRAVAMAADDATWEKLRALAAAAPTPLEQRFYLDALAYVRDDALAEKTLELFVGPETPKQFGPRMIRTVTEQHPDLGWSFVQSHKDDVFGRIDEMQRYTFIPEIAGFSTDPRRAGELQDFFRKTLPGAPEGDMSRALGKIQSQSDVRTRRLPEINDWLSRTQ